MLKPCETKVNQGDFIPKVMDTTRCNVRGIVKIPLETKVFGLDVSMQEIVLVAVADATQEAADLREGNRIGIE